MLVADDRLEVALLALVPSTCAGRRTQRISILIRSHVIEVTAQDREAIESCRYILGDTLPEHATEGRETTNRAAKMNRNAMKIMICQDAMRACVKVGDDDVKGAKRAAEAELGRSATPYINQLWPLGELLQELVPHNDANAGVARRRALRPPSSSIRRGPPCAIACLGAMRLSHQEDVRFPISLCT